MAIGIFEGKRHGYDSADEGAFMYCTTTGWAFGPLFDGADDCKEFLTWLEKERGLDVDPGRIGTKDLYELYTRWMAETRRTT